MSDEDLSDLDELLEEALGDLHKEEEKNKIRAQKKEEALNEAVKKADAGSPVNDSSIEIMLNLGKSLLAEVSDESMDDKTKSEINSLQTVLQKLEEGDVNEAKEMMNKVLAGKPMLGDQSILGLEDALQDALSSCFDSTGAQDKMEGNPFLKDGENISHKENLLENLLGTSNSTASSPAAAENAENELMKMIFSTCSNPEVCQLIEEMTNAFPRWIEANKSLLSESELELRQKQYEKTLQLCMLIKENSNNGKTMEIIDLFNELSDLGDLPQDLSQFAASKNSKQEDFNTLEVDVTD